MSCSHTSTIFKAAWLIKTGQVLTKLSCESGRMINMVKMNTQSFSIRKPSEVCSLFESFVVSLWVIVPQEKTRMPLRKQITQDESDIPSESQHNNRNTQEHEAADDEDNKVDNLLLSDFHKFYSSFISRCPKFETSS